MDLGLTGKFQLSKILDALQSWTLIYLTLPIGVFLISWLKWPYAFISIALILSVFVYFKLQLSVRITKDYFMLFFSIVLFLLLLGFGELFAQNSDWNKHNAIFYEIFRSYGNPVWIKMADNQVFHLNYGLAYYLLPATIAGLFGFVQLIPILILMQTAAGLALLSIWIRRAFKLPLWSIFAIILLGRLDFIYSLKYAITEDWPWKVVFLKTGVNQFISNFDQGPQHALPGFLIFCWIFNEIKMGTSSIFEFLFLCVSGLFWSPFVPIALFPLFLFLKKAHFEKIKYYSTKLLIIPTFIFGVMIIYYYSLHFSLGQPEVVSFLSWKDFVVKSIFTPIMIHILIFVICLIVLRRSYAFELKICAVLILFAIGISFIRFGYFNDLLGKTVYLAIFLENVLFLKAIEVSVKGLPRFLLITFGLLHCLVSVRIMGVHVWAGVNANVREFMEYNESYFKSGKPISLQNELLPLSQKKGYPFIHQYTGENDIHFLKLVKKNEIE